MRSRFALLSFLLLLGGTVSAQQPLSVRLNIDPALNDSTIWLMATEGTTSSDTTSFGTCKLVCAAALNDTFSIEAGFSGRIYIFLNVTDTSLIPNQASEIASDTTLKVRYDFVEVTYFGAQGDCADLSSVDQYGINLSMSITDSSGVRSGSVGYQANTNTLVERMRSIADTAIYPAIYFDDAGTFMRVISPLHTPKGTYTDMKDYVNSLCTASDTIFLFDMYDGAKATYILTDSTSVDTTYGPKPFYYIALLSAANDSIILQPHSSVAGNAAYLQGRIAVNKADLYDSTYNMIYACDGPFFVSPLSLVPLLQDTIPDKVGFNDPWSTVVRNFLVGFNAGYYGTTYTLQNGSATYTANGNRSWDWNPLHAFPSGGTFDPYAEVIMESSNSYGFPFSDFLAAPLLQIYGDSLLTISIWSDTTTSFPDYTPNFPTMTADTINPVIGNNPLGGNNLVFDFGIGSTVQYDGPMTFCGLTFANGYNYTQMDTVSPNTTAPGNITFTGFPSYVDSVNQYLFSVEGKPFNLFIEFDSAGYIVQAMCDTPGILAKINNLNTAVTVTGIPYAIAPTYLVPAGSASSKKAKAKKEKKKPKK